MLSVLGDLKSACKQAEARSVGNKKGGCALSSRDGKIYTGFFCRIDENFSIEPVDMALSLGLGDGCNRFTAAYLSGEAFNLPSLKRLSKFGDLLINYEKDGQSFTSTLKNLILLTGEKE